MLTVNKLLILIILYNLNYRTGIKMNREKTLTSIYVNKELLEIAKEIGLNISKICEHSLKVYVEAIKQADQQILNKNNRRDIRTTGFGLVGSPGFEPGIASAPGWYPRPN